MDFIDRFITAITQTHPLHPMIVHFPIALSGAAFLFVLVAVWKKNDLFEKMAFANIVLTVFGSIAAGLTGLYDNQVNYLGDAANANVKIILATALLIVSGATAIVRWRQPDVFNSSGRAVYIGGYVISFVLTLILAFLGGVILYGF
jgi:uncharacterized membrane protein